MYVSNGFCSFAFKVFALFPPGNYPLTSVILVAAEPNITIVVGKNG